MTVQDSILRSCRKFKPAEDVFKQKLWEMVCAEANKEGTILKKKRFTIRKNAITFTVTVERGDTLNDNI